MTTERTSVTVFAPATVANVAVAFDVLGFPLDRVGDRITLVREPGEAHSDEDELQIVDIGGTPEAADIPKVPAANTATGAIQSLLRACRERLPTRPRLRLRLQKGIPIGSGMGGSAASAVGAAVAANELLGFGLTKDQLVPHAIFGERISGEDVQPDNVAGCLYGGLTFLVGTGDPIGRVVTVPVAREIACVVAHPHIRVETRVARAILAKTVTLRDHVRQSALMAGFLAGCYTNDVSLLQACLEDLIIEPQRAQLIPGFASVKAAALASGAYGCSISGAGPSLFAWTSWDAAPKVAKAMTDAFAAAGTQATSYISGVDGRGARVETPERP